MGSPPPHPEEQSTIPEKQKLVRVTLLAYRNPKLTEDEFHEHWTNVHAPKVSAHLAKFGILSYRQYHCPSSLRQSYITGLTSMGKDASSGADYDGFVELLMPDLSCYEKALSDQHYKDVIAPDDTYFADMERSKIMVGWEEVYVKDGKVVNIGMPIT